MTPQIMTAQIIKQLKAMSIKNRSELSTSMNGVFVPVLQIADHLSFLDGDLKDSLVLRKDVISTDTASSNNYNLDLANCDYFELNCDNRNINITIQNLNNGEVKYIKLTNYQSISFAFTPTRFLCGKYWHSGDYNVYMTYRLTKKANIIYIEPFWFCESWILGSKYVGSGSFDFLEFEGKYININLQLVLPTVSLSNAPTELGSVSGIINLHVETEADSATVKFIKMEAYDDFGSGDQFMGWRGWMNEVVHSITWTKIFG